MVVQLEFRGDELEVVGYENGAETIVRNGKLEVLRGVKLKTVEPENKITGDDLNAVKD